MVQRRRIKIDNADGIDAGEVSAAASVLATGVIEALPTAAIEVAAMPDEGWIENRWHELPHYECVHCPFDTLDADEIREHCRTQHSQASLGG